MGIYKLLKVEVNGVALANTCEIINLKDIQHQTIGVDALITIIQSLTNGYILKSNGKVTVHINTIINKLLKMTNKQIWVFDNKDKLEAKQETVSKRKFNAEVFQHTTLSEAVKDVKQILTILGIPYITAPPKVEAENYLVELKRMGLIDYILSTDTDVLAYGEDLLSYKDAKFCLFEIKKILKLLNMDQNTFRKFCCLLGNDFAKKTVGVSHQKMLDHLDREMTKEQIEAYVLFSLRVNLTHKKEQLVAASPKFNLEIVEYLKALEFTNLVDTIQKML